MQRKLSVGTQLFGFWLCTIGFLTSWTHAQSIAKTGGTELVSVASEMLENGLELERSQRWQEAIQHYEKCLKVQPTAMDLERRLQIARIHHDVVRRYSDSTFVDSIKSIQPAIALDLFSEVLGKLELNYVEPLNLNELARHGTAFLEVALTEPSFLELNLSNADSAKIEAFRANIHKIVLSRDLKNRSEARSLIMQVAGMAENQIGLNPTATIHEYVAGVVGLLDPYSGYMTPGELSEVMLQIKGNLIGIGVELKAEKDELKILEVFAGSPAEQAGLQANDAIVQVDQHRTSVVTGRKAADLLRGEAQSRVRLRFVRGELPEQEVIVTRRRVEVPSIATTEIIDRRDGIGYVRITNFQETTANELDQAMWALHRQGMRSLIIDLRRNPGGLLDSAVDIADRFLKKGGIVSTRGRNGVENRNYAAREPGTWDIPLTVLIDGDSASASEIFAGAIRDHRRGTLVGQTSYGKGTVQGLFHTDTVAGGLRLTVSKFFSPLGHPISHHGVSPDVVVESQPIFRDGRPVTVAKPVVGNDGIMAVDFKNRDQDLALRRAIETAREAIKVAQVR